MNKYDHNKLDKKWQKNWLKSKIYQARDKSKKPKWYSLVEFPYPSGAGLHTGHIRSYTALDVISRKRRMQNYNVLYPMGWDAFGLPTENYAIKTGRPPQEVTAENIATFKSQLQSLGYSFDWTREISTADPEYYKWTQWMFIQFFKTGLAYKAKVPINWCTSCKIGLANEEVVAGTCERCGGKIEKRDKAQWMLKITAYADKLLNGLEDLDFLPEIKIAQKNWIGKSQGINIRGKIKDTNIEFEAFDSVPQTFMAQTFAVIAPDHPKLKEIVRGVENEEEILVFAEKLIKERASKDYDENKKSKGIFTHNYIQDPFGTGDLPLWIASFAVADYGSGIVFCSAHDQRDFDFAKKYNIPLRPVMFPANKKEAKKIKDLEYCYQRDPEGILSSPKKFAGRRWGEVRQDVINYLSEEGIAEPAVNYKLRDWVFSRQRYWGEPIPMIKCEKCDYQPVPDKQLPVKLPPLKNYQPRDDGQSPLASVDSWANTTCPKCKGKAKRETDVMPNWAGSSWYFMRYVDPKNKQSFANPKLLKSWMPIDWYNGGMEHATLHLLYSRFWNQFFFDKDLVPTKEPYKKRTKHGMVLASDGKKMSKSLGNVVRPDNLVKEFGADALRLYEMFMGPFDQVIAWDKRGILGPARFLERVWRISSRDWFMDVKETQPEVAKKLHQTIQKVSADIETMSFNTAISTMMEFTNMATSKITKQDWEKFLVILSPFAPHITEEIWSNMGNKKSIHLESWPEHNQELAQEENFELVIQVNGKVRTKIVTQKGITQAKAEELALASPLTQKWLAGEQAKKTIFVPDRLINFIT